VTKSGRLPKGVNLTNAEIRFLRNRLRPVGIPPERTPKRGMRLYENGMLSPVDGRMLSSHGWAVFDPLVLG
jgi:hypothetical protein